MNAPTEHFTEHLLLAPLGGSLSTPARKGSPTVGTIFGLLDWLNHSHSAPWPSPQKEEKPSELPPVTELWVVTTNLAEIVDGLEEQLFEPLKTHFPGLICRVYVADIPDIRNHDDNQRMTETIYRLILQGETWWKENKDQRRFSVSVVGGRKTMSTALQQAATFLEVHYLFHNPYNGFPEPRNMKEVIANRANHYPVIIENEPTNWRYWLEEAWKYSPYSATLLTPATFKIDPLPGSTANTILVDGNSLQSPSCLHRALRDVAKTSRKFADRALACGAGGRFMRHDISPVVEAIVANCNNSMTQALKDYLDASSLFADYAIPRPFDGNTPLHQLPTICEQALIMGVGKYVPKKAGLMIWELKDTLQNTLRLEIKGVLPENDTLQGMNQQGLLLVLRNLIANVKKHGVLDNFETPTLTLEVATDETNLFLRALNPVGPHQSAQLMAFAGTASGTPGLTLLPGLLTPFKALGHGAGDGLGLYSVQTMVDKANAAVKLRPPCLVTSNGQQNFLVELIFPKRPKKT